MKYITSDTFCFGVVFLSVLDVGAVLDKYEDYECPVRLNPSIFFSSNRIPIGSADRAKKTIPEEFYLAKSNILFAGLGIFASTFVRKYTWLGQYEGEVFPSEDHQCDETNCLEYAWKIENSDGSHFYVDGFDERKSNWLRYINCARHMLEENVDSTQCYGRRYYLTVRDIAPGQELLAYYGDNYATELGIVAEEFTNREFWTQKYQPKPSLFERMCKEGNSSNKRFCESHRFLADLKTELKSVLSLHKSRKIKF